MNFLRFCSFSDYKPVTRIVGICTVFFSSSAFLDGASPVPMLKSEIDAEATNLSNDDTLIQEFYHDFYKAHLTNELFPQKPARLGSVYHRLMGVFVTQKGHRKRPADESKRFDRAAIQLSLLAFEGKECLVYDNAEVTQALWEFLFCPKHSARSARMHSIINSITRETNAIIQHCTETDSRNSIYWDMVKERSPLPPAPTVSRAAQHFPVAPTRERLMPVAPAAATYFERQRQACFASASAIHNGCHTTFKRMQYNDLSEHGVWRKISMESDSPHSEASTRRAYSEDSPDWSSVDVVPEDATGLVAPLPNLDSLDTEMTLYWDVCEA